MTAGWRNRWTWFDGPPRGLRVLYADTFVMALGFYMLVPLLAYHLLESLALSLAVVGALSAVRTAAQQGLMPWSGRLADRMDYKRAIAAGVLIRSAGFALLGVADDVPVLAVACVLAGAGGSLFHPASYAAYAALASDRDRVTVYAARETLSNLGFVLGPVAGGLLAALDFRWVCFGAAALFGVAFVVTVAGLPSGLASPPGARRSTLREVAAHGAFVRYCLLAAGIWVLISQLYLAVPVRAAAVLPDAVGVGAVYSAAALAMVAVTVPLNRSVQRRLPARAALALGTAGLGGGLAVMGWWTSAAGLFAGVAAFTIGQVLTQPTMNAVVAGYARRGATGAYFGVQGLALAVGGVVGNLGGGFLYGLATGPGPGQALPWAIFAGWAAVLGGLLLVARIDLD